MRHATAAVSLALLLVVSGCAGLSGDTQTTTPQPTTTAPTSEQPTATTTTTQPTTTQAPTTTTTPAEPKVSLVADAPASTDLRTLTATVTLINNGTAAATVNETVTVYRVGYTQYNETFDVSATLAPGESVTRTIEYRIYATGEYAITHDGERVGTVEANSWTDRRTWWDRVKASIDAVFDGTAEVGV